jgi:hypothetical protein
METRKKPRSNTKTDISVKKENYQTLLPQIATEDNLRSSNKKLANSGFKRKPPRESRRIRVNQSIRMESVAGPRRTLLTTKGDT